MNVYFRNMRTKDEEKKQALFEATVKTVNDIGFAASSVSKIAREAGVSSSTLYVYHKNKEELLVSTYVEIKKKISRALLGNYDETLPLRDILRRGWYNMYVWISENQVYYDYVEQFASSPFRARVNHDVLDRYFLPIFQVMEKGIEQKIIKNVKRPLLSAFMFHPLTRLAAVQWCQGVELDENDIEIAFAMAWDAIRF